MEAMAWCKTNLNDYFLVNTLVLASIAMTIQGDPSTGQKLATSALDTAEHIANPSAIAWALSALADAERLDSPGGAHVHLEEALAVGPARAQPMGGGPGAAQPGHVVLGRSPSRRARSPWWRRSPTPSTRAVLSMVDTGSDSRPSCSASWGLVKEATLLLHAAGRDEVAIPTRP